MLDNLQASARVWGRGSPHLPSSLCRSYPLFLAPRGLTPKMLVMTLLRCSGEGVPRTARRVLPGPTVHPAGTWPCPSSGSPAGSWAEYRAESLAPAMASWARLLLGQGTRPVSPRAKMWLCRDRRLLFLLACSPCPCSGVK